MALWPQLPLELRRSMVFSLLLLGGGALVWLNGTPGSRLPLAGAALGLGLWLLVLLLPGVRQLLSLAPLGGADGAVMLLATALSLGLARQLSPSWSTETGTPADHCRRAKGMR
ncbi:MAG: hypothetical protein ACKOBY_09370 [Cyanobium sp.]